MPTSVGNFAIKYVTSGTEHYMIDKKVFEMKEQSFLVTCTEAPGIAIVESKSFVDGICIDINYQTIAEAYTVLSAETDIDLDDNLCNYFMSPEFIEGVYPIASSSLGGTLSRLARQLQDFSIPEEAVLNEEWFFELAEKAVIHENENLKGMQSLSCIKSATKKEILRRLLKAKIFMEENFILPLKITEIARVALMSEFHFFRSFREAFGISPYGFLQKKRLEAAYHALCHTEITISDAASESGFIDISTFSKAFKKYFGISPSHLAKTKSPPSQ